MVNSRGLEKTFWALPSLSRVLGPAYIPPFPRHPRAGKGPAPSQLWPRPGSPVLPLPTPVSLNLLGPAPVSRPRPQVLYSPASFSPECSARSLPPSGFCTGCARFLEHRPPHNTSCWSRRNLQVLPPSSLSPVLPSCHALGNGEFVLILLGSGVRERVGRGVGQNRGSGGGDSTGERGCLWVTGFESGLAGDRKTPPTTWGVWPRASVHLIPRQVTHPEFRRILSISAFGPGRSSRARFD